MLPLAYCIYNRLSCVTTHHQWTRERHNIDIGFMFTSLDAEAKNRVPVNEARHCSGPLGLVNITAVEITTDL